MLVGPLGLPEILLIVVIILLIFGGRKIPEIMRSMGEGVKEFKKASKGLTEEQPPSAEKNESQKVREAATALGISTEGKTDEELRKEISGKVKS